MNRKLSFDMTAGNRCLLAYKHKEKEISTASYMTGIFQRDVRRAIMEGITFPALVDILRDSLALQIAYPAANDTRMGALRVQLCLFFNC